MEDVHEKRSSDEAGAAGTGGNTAPVLSTVGCIRPPHRVRKGEASRTLDRVMPTRLLLEGRDGGITPSATVYSRDKLTQTPLLEGGASGMAPGPVDARGQLITLVAAERQVARSIPGLLHSDRDLRVVDRQPTLLPLHIALMSMSAQVHWSPAMSVGHFLAILKGREDLKTIRILAQNEGFVGELAYIYAIEGSVSPLAMLLLVVEDKILGQLSVVINGIRTTKSIYNSVLDEALSMGDAPAGDGIERRKALIFEVQLLNQFGSAAWSNENDRGILPPLFRAAKAGDINVIKMLLMGNADVNEVDSEGNTALHWYLSGTPSTQSSRIALLLLKSGAPIYPRTPTRGNYKALQSQISWTLLKITSLITIIYSVTAMFTFFGEKFLDLNSVSKNTYIATGLYITHLMLSYLIIKPSKWFLKDHPDVKKMLPYFCFISENITSILFATAIVDHISLRAALLTPCLLMPTLPYILIMSAVRGRFPTFWELLVISGNLLVYIFNEDSDGYLGLPGRKLESSYAAAGFLVLFFYDNLIKMKVHPNKRVFDAALELYMDVTTDSRRTLVTTVVCVFFLNTSS